MGFDIGFSDIDCDDLREHPGWDADPAEMYQTPRGIDAEQVAKYERSNGSMALTCQIEGAVNSDYNGKPGHDRNISRLTTAKENRVNRLKALGNAVVPQQAKLALELLIVE